jgi:hypothetical protein
MSGLVVRPMQPADLAFIRLQPEQRALAPQMSPATADHLLLAGLAFTAFDRTGWPIMAAGLILSMGPPAIAWAVLAPEAGPHLLAIGRRVRVILEAAGTVETGVDPSFAAGQRWARLLGFRPMGRPVDRWDSPACELWRRGPANDNAERASDGA